MSPWGFPGAVLFGMLLALTAYAQRPRRRRPVGVSRLDAAPILGARETPRGRVTARDPARAATGVVRQLLDTHTVLVAGDVPLPTVATGRILRTDEDPDVLVAVANRSAGERLAVVVRPAPDEVDEWVRAAPGLPAGIPYLVIVGTDAAPDLEEEGETWRIAG